MEESCIKFNLTDEELDEIRRLSPVELHTMFLAQEEEIDRLLASGKMDQESAWDCYFALLHECDVSDFLGDRPRILSKIDTTRYNPFTSKNPDVIMLARLRASNHIDDKKDP